MIPDYSRLEHLFLGLADKTRLRLLGLMAPGPVTVGHLVTEVGESQPKVSRHLAYLRNAGLVETTRDGKWIYYGICPQPDDRCDVIFASVLDQLADAPPRRPRRKPIVEAAYVPETVQELYEPEMEPASDGNSDGRSGELEIFLL
jgi:ArsR family transcriptional regulator